MRCIDSLMVSGREGLGKLLANYPNRVTRAKVASFILEEESFMQRQQALLNQPCKNRESCSESFDARSVRQNIVKLQEILRDTDANSSILGRFDEITKLLFLKLVADKQGEILFEKEATPGAIGYTAQIRKKYRDYVGQYSEIFTEQFSELACSDEAIIQCGALLAEWNLENTSVDIKGLVYEEVIRRTFDKSDHQQFFTPQPIVAFIVAFLSAHLKGVIADPACGTAGFLVEILHSKASYEQLIGFEIDERLAWVSRINLLLHGEERCKVECLGEGGSLGPQILPYSGQIDVIITNPPFGSDFSDAIALKDYMLAQGRVTRRRGILFIERCWTLLRDAGILSIIIDEGVLNQPHARDVRRFILENFDILAIISLPETAFLPYATVYSSILVLKKNTLPKRVEQVFFAKAENIGRKNNGDDDIVYDEVGKSCLNDELPNILTQWEEYVNGRSIKETELIFLANIRGNLFQDDSLRLDFRYHHPARFRSKAALSLSKHRLVSLAELCYERNETNVPANDMPDQFILYTGLANIESKNGVAHQVLTPAIAIKSLVRYYNPGDIIFARMRPALRKVALMNFVEGGFVSPECSVLTVRSHPNGTPFIKPELLAVILRSELVYGQITHLIAGIGRPRINSQDLRRVLIPVPPDSVQEESSQAYEQQLQLVRDLRKKADSLLQEAVILETRAVEDLTGKMGQG